MRSSWLILVYFSVLFIKWPSGRVIL
jgi:hypothetical protein